MVRPRGGAPRNVGPTIPNPTLGAEQFISMCSRFFKRRQQRHQRREKTAAATPEAREDGNQPEQNFDRTHRSRRALRSGARDTTRRALRARTRQDAKFALPRSLRIFKKGFKKKLARARDFNLRPPPNKLRFLFRLAFKFPSEFTPIPRQRVFGILHLVGLNLPESGSTAWRAPASRRRLLAQAPFALAPLEFLLGGSCGRFGSLMCSWAELKNKN